MQLATATPLFVDKSAITSPEISISFIVVATNVVRPAPIVADIAAARGPT
jgi:hypothetical protein